MLHDIAREAEDTAARTARTAVLGLGAVCALAVGLAFLTLAAWLFLIQITAPASAALILGAFYVGFGLLLVALLSARRRAREHERALARAQQRSGTLQQLVLAFFTGLRAGKASRGG